MKQVYTTNEIVEIIQRGTRNEQNSVISFLYRRFKPAVSAYVHQQSGTKEERDENAKDIFQEVIITFFDQVILLKFEPKSLGELEGYFVTVAKHKWLKRNESETRRKKREDTFLQNEYLEGHHQNDALNFLLVEEEKKKAFRIFHKLDEKCQTLLKAYYDEKQSLKEIALNLGFSTPENAKVSKHRCMLKLQNLLLKNG